MCGKKQFTKKEALSVFNQNNANRTKWRKEKRMYFCETCSCFHLTSKEEHSTIEEIETKNEQWKKFGLQLSFFLLISLQ